MNTFVRLLTCFAIFYSIFSPFRLIFDGGQTIVTFMATCTLLIRGNLFTNKTILIAILFCSITLFLGMMDVEYFQNYIPNAVLILFSVATLEFFITTQDIRFAKYIIVTLMLTLTLLTAISIPQFIIMPNLTRLINSQESDLGTFAYWTISYHTIHMIPLLIIPIATWLKQFNNKGPKLLIIVLIVMFLVMLIYADATTPLILTFFALAIVFLYVPQKNMLYNIIRILLVTSVCTLLLNKTIIISVLETVQPVFKGSSNDMKITEMIDYINMGSTSGDMELRENYYIISLESIAENPFMPEDDIKKIGKHMFLIDHIAAMGFPLFIIMCCMLLRLYNRASKLLTQNKGMYKIAFFLFLTMACVKNVFLFSSVAIFVPMFLVLIEKKISILK